MGDNHRKTIKEVLTKLEVNQFNDVSGKISDKDIADFENEYELSFPAAYREFLLICNGVFFDNILDFKRVDNSPLTMNDGTAYFDGFDGFLDLNGVIEATEDYAGRIPNSLIPIGDGLGGDLICIGVGENVFGKIYFWDPKMSLWQN